MDSPSIQRNLLDSPSVHAQQLRDRISSEFRLPSPPPAEPQPRTSNEHRDLSASAFIPLAQRKRRLEENSSTVRPEPAKRQLTEPRSPVLLTRTRAKPAPPLKEDRVLQDISHRGGYKANKIDRRIFESSGDLGVPKITKPALTVPKSPSFTKRTHPARPTSTATTFKSPPRHALPQHQHYRKFRPVIAQQGLVSSAESARRLSQEKLKRSIKPAATTVPQPDPSRSRGAKPELTIPKPFKLETDARGERYQEQFRFKLDKWKQIEKDHQFKALPLPVYPEKFVPARSTKPLTHTEPPRLRTDDRAHVREVLEQEKQRKGKIMQEMRAEKAREDELREQQELRELRLRLVPHPTPIRDYPRIDIHKSSRPLTVPRSPSIGEKRKRQMTLEREVPDAQAEEGIHRQVSSIVDGKRRREMTLEREVPRTSEERHYH